MATVTDLVNNPHESLDVELKEWLDLQGDVEHRGKLAKAIIAIANHGGGHILIGFTDDRKVASNRPSILTQYSQDEINGIVKKFCEPAFHVAVQLGRRTDDGCDYPVITVPGGHRMPIRSRSETQGGALAINTYYIRRLGPSSESPQNGQEWDQLIEQCIRNRGDELADVLRDVITGSAPEREVEPTEAERHTVWVESSISAWHASLDRHGIKEGEYQWMPDGHWTFSYSVVGEHHRLDLNELKDVLQKVYRQITGWPVFQWARRDEVRPVQREAGIIECHRADHVAHANPAHSDYWRAAAEGRLFHRRGYQEDSGIESIERATVFDYILPIWRNGEALLHAARFSEAVGGRRVLVAARWTGLKNRALTVIPGVDRHYEIDTPSGMSAQEMIDTTMELDAGQISASLPEILREFLKPLYAAFNFEPAPSIDYISRQIDEMLGKR